MFQLSDEHSERGLALRLGLLHREAFCQRSRWVLLVFNACDVHVINVRQTSIKHGDAVRKASQARQQRRMSLPEKESAQLRAEQLSTVKLSIKRTTC